MAQEEFSFSKIRFRLENIERDARFCLNMMDRYQSPQPSATPPPPTGTPVPPTDVYKVIAALAAASLDVSRVDVVVVNGRLAVTPRKFLGPDWGGYNDFLRGVGFTWVSKGRLSHWEAA